MLLSFFSFLTRSKNLSHFSSLIFLLWSAWTAKCTMLQVFYLFIYLFLLVIARSGLLSVIWLYDYTSKSQGILCVLFSRSDSGLCIYHLAACSNFSFWHSSQKITYPTQSCLVLDFLLASLQHLLIVWLMFSFLSSYKPHLLLFYP